MARFRLKRTIATLPSGTKVQRTKAVAAPELEWRLQAAAVRRLKARSDFNELFTLAADFNAARRSPQEAVKAKATGIAAGDPDLRIYGANGRLLLIEMKAENGRLSQDQKDRHALLERLGYRVVTVKVATEDEAADAVEAAVASWIWADESTHREIT